MLAFLSAFLEMRILIKIAPVVFTSKILNRDICPDLIFFGNRVFIEEGLDYLFDFFKLFNLFSSLLIIFSTSSLGILLGSLSGGRLGTILIPGVGSDEGHCRNGDHGLVGSRHAIVVYGQLIVHPRLLYN